MATYCIGDVQGCFQELMLLLQKINFDSKKDCLWFAGDLINRGPQSLEVLRFVKDLPNKVVVLGNHDLHLLLVYHNIVNFESKDFDEILRASDLDEIVDWLRRQSFLYCEPELNFVLTHAGIYPKWNLQQAKLYAKEVESTLQGSEYVNFLSNLYGNEPSKWSENLSGWDRLRFITNCFTRMRFCKRDGSLNLVDKGEVGSQMEGDVPWFKFPNREIIPHQLVFGHWAALNGVTNEPNIYALDTGCVWGRNLTAMRLEDSQRFECSCK